MKYRFNSYLRIINGVEEKYYCIEYNDTDEDFDCDWYELDDFTEAMCKDIIEILNTKYSKESYYKYNK